MYHRYRIYMGRNIGGSAQNGPIGFVGRKDFWNFVEEKVPFKGFTVYDATGHWYGENELSFVLEVLTNQKGAVKTVEAIAMAYKERFHQDSVMYTYEKVPGFGVV